MPTRPAALHPRIAFNTLSMAPGSLAEHAEFTARLGAAAISPVIDAVETIGTPAAAKLLGDAGLQVATLTHRAFAFAEPGLVAPARERLDRTIEAAAAIGAASVTLTTGGRGALRWPDAARAFAEAIAPCAGRARDCGVALSVETTSHLYADASIAHRLRDLITICTQADVGLGIDLFACWFDSDIEDAIAAAAPLTAMVQVSDYMAGDRGLPCRAVPGDGMAHLYRLVPLIVQAGYRGWFDLEIIGPRIESESPAVALTRGAARLGAWIDSVDAH